MPLALPCTLEASHLHFPLGLLSLSCMTCWSHSVRLPGARRGSLLSRDGFLLSVCLAAPGPQPPVAGLSFPVSERAPLPCHPGVAHPFSKGRAKMSTSWWTQRALGPQPAFQSYIYHYPPAGGGAGLGVRLSWEPHPLTLRSSLEGQQQLSCLRKPGRPGQLSWVFRRNSSGGKSPRELRTTQSLPQSHI